MLMYTLKASPDFDKKVSDSYAKLGDQILFSLVSGLISRYWRRDYESFNWLLPNHFTDLLVFLFSYNQNFCENW